VEAENITPRTSKSWPCLKAPGESGWGLAGNGVGRALTAAITSSKCFRPVVARTACEEETNGRAGASA